MKTEQWSDPTGPVIINSIYAAAPVNHQDAVWVHVCARAPQATAEPAACACGMQYLVERNRTFMETATSSQFVHRGRTECLLLQLYSEQKDF